MRACRDSKELDWPPSADDMHPSSEELLPQKLIQFLNLVTAERKTWNLVRRQGVLYSP